MANYYRIESVPDGFVKLKINAIYRKDSDGKIIKFKISGGYGLDVTNAEEISEVNSAIATKHKGYTKWGRELSDLTIKRITKDAHYKTVQGPPAPLVGPVPYDKLSNADKDYHRNTSNTSPKQGMNAGFVTLSAPTGESSYGTKSRSTKNTQQTKSKPRQQSTPKEEVEVIPSDWSKFNKKEIFELFSCAWGWYNRPMSEMKSKFHGVGQDSTFDVINPFIIYGIMKKRVKAENLPAYNILIKLPGLQGNPELQNYYDRMFNKKTSDDADAQKAANRYDSRNMKIGGMNFNIGKLPNSLRHTINAGRLTSRALFGTARGIIATSKWLGTSKLPWPKQDYSFLSQGKGEQEGSKAEQATANQQAATQTPASSNAKESKDDKVNTVRFDKLSKILTAIKDSLKPKDKEAKNVEGVDKADLSDTTKQTSSDGVGKTEKEKKSGGFGWLLAMALPLLGLLGSMLKKVKDFLLGSLEVVGKIMAFFGEKTISKLLQDLRIPRTPTSIPEEPNKPNGASGLPDSGSKTKDGKPVKEEDKKSKRLTKDEQRVKAIKERADAKNGIKPIESATENIAKKEAVKEAVKDVEKVAVTEVTKAGASGALKSFAIRAAGFLAPFLLSEAAGVVAAGALVAGGVYLAYQNIAAPGTNEMVQNAAIAKSKADEIKKHEIEIQQMKDKQIIQQQQQVSAATPPAPIIVPSGGSGGFQNSSRMDNDSIMYEYLFKTARPSFVC